MVINMYWSVYKNLERDVLTLADYLLFTDKQLQVYSVFIADLLVRCAIEIEALSKELYIDNGGPYPVYDATNKERNLYFDTDCLNLLKEKWNLTEKKIIIAASNFYFEDEKNRILQPLKKAHKRGSSGSKWKQAYQAVKHDRSNSIEKATVENLIHALGSLYILNIYYKESAIKSSKEFDYSQGSNIFTSFSVDATLTSLTSKMKDTDISNYSELPFAIFVKKYTAETVVEIEKEMIDEDEKIRDFCMSEPSVSLYLSKNPQKHFSSMTALVFEVGGVDLLKKWKKQSLMNKILQNIHTEIIYYKNEDIYFNDEAVT